jgi:hypothetical protein
MIFSRPRVLLVIGFVMMLLGVIFPFLMVMKIVPSTFFLNFFSYIVSVLGMFIGLIGAAFYVKLNKKK